MGRFVIVEIIVFFAPIILFLLYVRIFHKKRAIEALNRRVLAILIGLGVVCMGLGAVYLSSLDSKDLGGIYVPAKVVDGVDIPAHFE
ncbi:MAG: hypothetical protein OCD03_00775 [Hyphomicrobiales bacterium]